VLLLSARCALCCITPFCCFVSPVSLLRGGGGPSTFVLGPLQLALARGLDDLYPWAVVRGFREAPHASGCGWRRAGHGAITTDLFTRACPLRPLLHRRRSSPRGPAGAPTGEHQECTARTATRGWRYPARGFLLYRAPVAGSAGPECAGGAAAPAKPGCAPSRES
jgi:hypothetical protein